MYMYWRILVSLGDRNWNWKFWNWNWNCKISKCRNWNCIIGIDCSPASFVLGNMTDQYNLTPPTIAICSALITIPAAFIPLPKSFVPTCNTIPSTFFPSFLTVPIWTSTNLTISLILAPDSPHTFTSSARTVACSPSRMSFAGKILSPTTIHTPPFLSFALTPSLLPYPWSPPPSNSCSLSTPDPSPSSLISSSLTSPSLELDSKLYVLSNLALFPHPL